MSSRTHPVGTGSVRARPTTRPGTPLQDRSPTPLWTTGTTVTTVPSQGHPPAHTRHAISTREHQTGGAPTRSAATRRGLHARPPPAAHPLWLDRSLGPRRSMICSRLATSRAAYGVADPSADAPLDPATRPQQSQRSRPKGIPRPAPKQAEPPAKTSQNRHQSASQLDKPFHIRGRRNERTPSSDPSLSPGESLGTRSPAMGVGQQLHLKAL
jgi:hypothetical protein